MKLSSLFLLGVVSCAAAATIVWSPQVSGTNSEFRGLSVVGESVIWAAGRDGTYARSTDAGASWRADSVPGAADLFFVDVHAVDSVTAYLLGTHFDGGLAKIFKTMDGGSQWIEQFSDSTAGVFFDGMAFWDADRGVAFSDPVDGSFLIVRTENGGSTWERVPPENIPPPLPGEAGFAASGTAITVFGTEHVWFGTGGGSVARVFASRDGGRSWTVDETPIAGSGTAGIFGIAFRDTAHGLVVGGDYRRPGEFTDNVARTRDGGRTWSLVASAQPAGVRYGAAYVQTATGATLVAVGPAGWGYSADDGETWISGDSLGFNTIAAGPSGLAWVAGVEGRISRLKFPVR